MCERTVGHGCCFRRSRRDEPDRRTEEANIDSSRTESPPSNDDSRNNNLERRTASEIIDERVDNAQSTQNNVSLQSPHNNDGGNNALEMRTEPQIIDERVDSAQSTHSLNSSQTCSVSSEKTKIPENPRHDDDIYLNEYSHSTICPNITVES